MKQYIFLIVFFVTLFIAKGQTSSESVDWLNIKGNEIIRPENIPAIKYDNGVTKTVRSFMQVAGSSLTYKKSHKFKSYNEGLFKNWVTQDLYELDLSKIQKVIVTKDAYFNCYAIEVTCLESSVNVESRWTFHARGEYNHIDDYDPRDFVKIYGNIDKNELLRVRKAIIYLAKLKGAKIDQTYKEDTF